MKIGITCYPTYGGSGIVATELGKSLAKRGHEVHFICYAVPRRLTEFLDRIFYHEVTVSDYPLFEYPPYSLQLASRMVEVTRSVGLDLLHVHYAIPHAVSAYLAKQMLTDHKLPVITTLHGTDITLVGSDSTFLPIIKFSIEQSDGVTAVSNFLKEATYQTFPTGKKIEVIYDFIDPEEFRPIPNPKLRESFAPNGEKILAHLSNFRPVKRIPDVLDIYHQVNQKIPSKLIMIGDGPERPKAEEHCRTCSSCEDNVTFLGKQDSVAEFLSLADVFLLPSESESFGLAALEAMSCAVPVVASRVGGVPEVIVEGKCGFLRPLYDTRAMAEAVLTILSDPGLHAQMRQNARNRVLTHFSDEIIVPQYIDYYQRFLNGR